MHLIKHRPEQLGEKSGARSGFGTELSVFGLEEAIAQHPLQVKGRRAGGQVHLSDQLAPAHGHGTAYQCLVKRSPHRVRQRCRVRTLGWNR